MKEDTGLRQPNPGFLQRRCVPDLGGVCDTGGLELFDEFGHVSFRDRDQQTA
jgi:hypothetical protein